MTDSMVERVARAICADLGCNPDAPHMAMDGTELRGWQEFEVTALAAIAAMEEPTEAMVDAGNAPHIGADGFMDDAELRERFRAMIRVAKES